MSSESECPPANAVHEHAEQSVVAYQAYVDELQILTHAISVNGFSKTNKTAAAIALDGGATHALRRLVGINALRTSGAFFTSAPLIRAVWRPLAPTLTPDSVIADPACGVGNLLIPALTYLTRKLPDPLRASSQVRGQDIIEPFVQAARTRLYLSALMNRRLSLTSPDFSSKDFEAVAVGDSLQNMEEVLASTTHVVLNPPYNTNRTKKTWAAGSINNAALFTELSLQHMQSGAHMAAILPDVLRSGRRYSRWRDEMESKARIRKVTSWGVFDDDTDVHVFVLHLTKDSFRRSSRSLRISSLANHQPANTATVSTYFAVSVGAVVPHRHPEEGPLRPFATAKLLPAWQTVSNIEHQRRFSGRCEKPPFVAVRRTSRPGQFPRAIATIVTGSSDVAVDNHLLVLRPHNGTEQQCQALINLLRRAGTTRWLDENFRCRHLTVEAIGQLLWPDEDVMQSG